MYVGPDHHTVLEDYFYIIKEHARNTFPPCPKPLRFIGRKVSEFKHEIFKIHFAGRRPEQSLTPFDLEILHRDSVLDNDDDIEYCQTSFNNPLVIYVPSDLTQDEYRVYTKVASDNLESNKQFGGHFNED